MLSIIRRTTPIVERSIPIYVRHASDCKKRKDKPISKIITDADVEAFKVFHQEYPHTFLSTKIDTAIRSTKESRGYSSAGSAVLAVSVLASVFISDTPDHVLKMINNYQFVEAILIGSGLFSLLYLPIKRSDRIEKKLNKRLERLYEIEDEYMKK